MLDSSVSEVKDHAKYSASGAERWLNCPGSIALSEDAPPQVESKYALEGTKAHACLEFLLRNVAKLDAAVKVAEGKYSEEMIEHALTTIQYITERLNDFSSPELLIEEKVDASHFTCEGQFGTLDVAIVAELDTLVVIDYKYGGGIAVDPVREDGAPNPQLLYYALGLAKKYDYAFSYIELVVVQPRAWHPDDSTIRSARLTIDEAVAFEDTYRDGVKACEDLLAPRNPGKWCKFCPAGIICPELKEEGFKKARLVFEDQTGVETLPEPVKGNAFDLSLWLELCDKLDVWIAKVREHAEGVLTRGEIINGWKMVEKRGIRKWIDKEKTSEEARELFGDFTPFSKPELLSPAQLEKATKGHPSSKKFIEERVKSESSGATLVKDDDKRPALTFTRPEDAFEVLELEKKEAVVKPFPAIMQGKVVGKSRR